MIYVSFSIFQDNFTISIIEMYFTLTAVVQSWGK